MTENQRFKIIREELGLDQSVFGGYIELKQGTVSDIERGKAGVSSKVLKKLLDNLGVNPEYIKEGKLPKFIDESKKISINTDFSNVKSYDISDGKRNMYIVPLKAVGGFLNGYEDTAFLNTLEKVSNPNVKGESFQFEVTGFSMVKKGNSRESYYPGDKIVCTIIEKIEWLQKGKIYLFQAKKSIGDGDGLSLKRFNGMEGNHLILVANDPEYGTIKLHAKDLVRVYYIEEHSWNPNSK